MYTTKKDQLIELLNTIKSDLSQYVKKAWAILPTVNSANASFARGYVEGDLTHYGYVKTNDMSDTKSIYVNKATRHPDLTMERIKLLVKVEDKIDDQLRGIFIKSEVSTDEVGKYLTDLKAELDLALNSNRELSKQYRHREYNSYYHNRASGMGVFSSVLNRSAVQSESTCTLEKAVQELAEFEQKSKMYVFKIMP